MIYFFCFIGGLGTGFAILAIIFMRIVAGAKKEATETGANYARLMSVRNEIALKHSGYLGQIAEALNKGGTKRKKKGRTS